MSVLLGAIADDFTGATDLANTLTGQGMRVIQIVVDQMLDDPWQAFRLTGQP